MVEYAIAIVGGGPAGISAAVHAARKGMSHILLESRPQLFGTVQEFPKSKPVMAPPEDGPVLSDLPFEPGPRDRVIDGWAEVVERSKVNVRLNAEVVRIGGSKDNFEITLADGDTITAQYVVMAVGMRGNLRRLSIPGAETNPRVQYRIEAPEEIAGERIVVVGRGDSAIEDALALAERNDVTMVYRGVDFHRAHPANARRVREAIRRGVIRAYSNSEPRRIDGRNLLIRRAA